MRIEHKWIDPSTSLLLPDRCRVRVGELIPCGVLAYKRMLEFIKAGQVEEIVHRDPKPAPTVETLPTLPTQEIVDLGLDKPNSEKKTSKKRGKPRRGK